MRFTWRFTRNWLVPLFLAVSLAGCGGGRQPSAEEKPASSPVTAAPPEPIDPATVGEITGHVSFEGPVPAKILIHMTGESSCKQASDEPLYREEVVVNANHTLRNVFVYVKEGISNRSFPAPAEPVVLDQKGCRYRPHVLGIMAGQKLEIRNTDPVSHNIHPVPAQNRAWNESMSPGAASLMQAFSQPEIMIPVKCNVHPWMRAYIGVVSNPFYAVTDEQGAFTLKGLPPGDYTIGAWQEKYGARNQKVTVGPKESKAIQFSFQG